MNDKPILRIRPKIVSPVCSSDELRNAVEMGANEVYCGMIPPLVGKRFGYDDIISRRQGRLANVTSMETMKSMLLESSRLHIPVALAINSHLSRSLLPHVVGLAETWARAGGSAVLLSDIALLIALKRKALPLKYHLSIMAAVFNTAAIDFYAELGVQRVVLPRELLFPEIARMTASHPSIEFEALVLHDRCPFIDGLCGFYHGTSFAPGTATSEPCTSSSRTHERRVYSNNLFYTGHGCSILLNSTDASHVQYCEEVEHKNLPACAACQLSQLAEAGVGFLKIAGRGLRATDKARSVSFVRTAVDQWHCTTDAAKARSTIRRLYQEAFGQPCDDSKCYYQAGA